MLEEESFGEATIPRKRSYEPVAVPLRMLYERSKNVVHTGHVSFYISAVLHWNFPQHTNCEFSVQFKNNTFLESGIPRLDDISSALYKER